MAWNWTQPTVGGADICPPWSGSIESAAKLPRQHGIAIVDGRRATADAGNRDKYTA